ncbi:MAG: DNA primase [Rickettsiales bacterium]|jgi:DNA primase|nr:DNA primase [Rickettsiales bacterium]
MAFDRTFTELLKSRLNIVDVIGRAVSLSKKGHQYWACCPFHNEKTPSFSVNEEKQFYHCFGCGAHGDAITFTMEHQHMSFLEAVEKLAFDAGLEVPKASSEERAKDRQSHGMYEIMGAACAFFQKSLRGRGIEYLKERRHLSDELIANFRLGYAPDGNQLTKLLKEQGADQKLAIAAGLVRISDKTGAAYDYFRDRVMFPIQDAKGRIIAFGGRTLGDGEPKYLNSPENAIFQKGRNLYALSQARAHIGKANPAIVCEGYMDTIALHKFGFRTAVAPLGTAFTEGQMEILWRMDDEPILCFDGDEAGRNAGIRAALRTLPALKPGKSLRFCLIDRNLAKDPDEFLHSFGHDKFKELLERPLSLVDMLWSYFTSSRTIRTPEQRAGLEKEIALETARIKNESVRGFYQAELKRRAAESFRSPAPPGAAPPKANPENSNERMALACAITYPELFSKLLESGRKIELKTPALKKIFDIAAAEIAVRPHTRETILEFLHSHPRLHGILPENMLRFEIDSLARQPDKAGLVIREKLLLLERGNIEAEIRRLTAAAMGAKEGEAAGMQEKIAALKSEAEATGGKLRALEE